MAGEKKMIKRAYHGSVFPFLNDIANDGALLSLWEREIRDLKRKPKMVMGLLSSNDTASLEIIALHIASRGYSELEIEQRVKSVSLTENLRNAAVYAFGNLGEKKGLIFGFDFYGDGEFTENHPLIFVSRRFSLDSLREIYFSPESISYLEYYKRLFARFQVTFKEYK